VYKGQSLYAVWIGTVATKSRDVWQSILILCAVVLGGMGSLRGVLLGSLILFPLRELLREEMDGTLLYAAPQLAIAVVILVCWGSVLKRLYRDEEQGSLNKAILGLAVWPFAFYWGWKNRARHPALSKPMAVWSVLLGVGLLLAVLQSLGVGA